MTLPDNGDDIVQGATKRLLDIDDVVAVLGTTDSGTPWLFQHFCYATVEGSSSTAAVLGYGGGWTGGNEHNTLKFPRLSLVLYADPLRDSNKNITEPGEVYRRIMAAYTVIDRYLHRPQGGVEMWGDIRTLSCVRSAEPNLYPVPSGEGVLRAQTFYAVEQG